MKLKAWVSGMIQECNGAECLKDILCKLIIGMMPYMRESFTEEKTDLENILLGCVNVGNGCKVQEQTYKK